MPQLLDDALGDGAALRRELIHAGTQVWAQLPAGVSHISDLAYLAQRVSVMIEQRGREDAA
jgi:hypothetical protein